MFLENLIIASFSRNYTLSFAATALAKPLQVYNYGLREKEETR